jgi:hypothetical protein
VTSQSESEEYPETYHAGAYWGPRKESAEECAQRTVAFLHMLASADPFLAQWYKPVRSRQKGLKPPLVPVDLPTLTEAFRRGVNREGRGPAIESLGFNIGLSNGASNRAYAFLRIFCGAYSEAVSNFCLLSPIEPGPDADRVLSAPVLTSVVRSMVLAWEPDWAVATSSKLSEVLSDKDRTGAFVGWVTYLSRQRGVVPPLPAPVRIEKVEDKGTLVTLTPDRLTADNPEHLELGRRVGELMSRAGLMRPIVTPR